MSGALILAAGFSRRFGSDKRRHVLSTGTPMLLQTVGIYAEVFDRVAVVLRPDDDGLNKLLHTHYPNAKLVAAANAHLGMGHSLAAGIQAAQDWSYAFIALADMPFVRTDTLVRLRTAMQTSRSPAIVIPTHEHSPGHPVGFSAEFFTRLATLTGDSGAREIVLDAQDAVTRIEVNDPGVVRDLDTPA